MLSPMQHSKLAPPARRGTLEEVLPSFQPPPPGEALPGKTTIKIRGVRVAVPILYYTTLQNRPLIYPLSRDLLGTVWCSTIETAIDITPLVGETSMSFLSRRMDLPLEVVHQLVLELDRSCGAEATRHQVTKWQQDLLSPHSSLHFDAPCNRCGQIVKIRMIQLFALTDIAAGITCGQFGQLCLPTGAPAAVVHPLNTRSADSYFTALPTHEITQTMGRQSSLHDPRSTIRPGQLLYDRSREGDTEGRSMHMSTPEQGRWDTTEHHQYVRGHVARTLSRPPPSSQECLALRDIQEGRQWEDYLNKIGRALQHASVKHFYGQGDPRQFKAWQEALTLFFWHYCIRNVALQASLAVVTFAEEANSWWIAHIRRHPERMLSWEQLIELIQVELVPEADEAAAMMQWDKLAFRGDLDEYFHEVRSLSQFSHMPPKLAQLRACRPFGEALVTRVRAAIAMTGVDAMSQPRWEEVVRAYVAEQQALPTFHSWATNDLEPVHRKLHARVTEVTSNPSQMKPFAKHPSSSATNTPQHNVPIKPRYGRGPRPCFVCGSEVHQWYLCDRKKRGLYAVCGSQEHLTRACAHRYLPATPIGPEHRGDTPTVRTVTLATDTEECRDTKPTASLLPNDAVPGSLGGDCPDREEKAEIPPSHVHLRLTQLVKDHLASTNEGMSRHEYPAWFHDVLARDVSTMNVKRGQPPLEDPACHGHLRYAVKLDSKWTTALLDGGASHSLLNESWVEQMGLHPTPLKRPLSLLNFCDKVSGCIQSVYRARQVELADINVPWTFYVAPNCPDEVVIGLDFIRAHGLCYHPRNDVLFAVTHEEMAEPLSPPVAESEENDSNDDGEDPQCTFVDVTTPEAYHQASTSRAPFPICHHFDQNPPLVECYSVTAATEEEKEELQAFRSELSPALLAVIDEFALLFAPPDREPPKREVKHHIHLIDGAVPIKRRPYPLPLHKLEEMRMQIAELRANGWIEPTDSPWGAPILFVAKKNQKWRMCVDFRDLNSATVDDSFPLPRIEVLLYKAAQSRVFSKLDLASGFHQIEVDRSSRPLTAFRLPEAVEGSALWQWKVMPFGLRNAPPTFQRAMSLALSGCEDCSVVYIDDILIFSNTEEEHLEHLRRVFAKLVSHAYHVRLQKCEFIKEEVEFLGHHVTPLGIRTVESKVIAVREWPMPLTTPKQVKAFLGLVM